MEYLLPYLSMVTVPYIMVGLERMLDYKGVGLERFHCIAYYTVLRMCRVVRMTVCKVVVWIQLYVRVE